MTPENFPKKDTLIITCEHGGNQIPSELLDVLPALKKKKLRSHEGYDIGALEIAQKLSQDLEIPLFYSEISRLVCDLNRSAYSTGPFARNIKPFTVKMTSDELLSKYYWPYRMKVEEAIGQIIRKNGSVLHLSIHSFTPKLKGEVRNADLGILYDPHRPFEKNFTSNLKDGLLNSILSFQDLNAHSPERKFYRVKMNYPYQGTDDGFTTYLRSVFPDPTYAGIEIEFNQACLIEGTHLESIYQCFKNGLLKCLS